MEFYELYLEHMLSMGKGVQHACCMQSLDNLHL